MLTSTGRNARMKHSTGGAGNRAKRREDRHPRPQHSTGRESTINHSTGMGSDVRRDEERARAGVERAAFEGATRWEPLQHA